MVRRSAAAAAYWITTNTISPVLEAAVRRVVGGDRLARTVAFRHQHLRGDAVFDELSAHGLGPCLRQRLMRRRIAGRIGVPADLERSAGAALMAVDSFSRSARASSDSGTSRLEVDDRKIERLHQVGTGEAGLERGDGGQRLVGGGLDRRVGAIRERAVGKGGAEDRLQLFEQVGALNVGNGAADVDARPFEQGLDARQLELVEGRAELVHPGWRARRSDRRRWCRRCWLHRTPSSARR